MENARRSRRDFLLVNFGRNVLAKIYRPIISAGSHRRRLRVQDQHASAPIAETEGEKYPATEAFCGTFHSDEGYEQMNASYDQASEGRLPEKTPCEVYCHTLTDDSILAPDLREQGFHTMTLFGLDAPWSLFARDNENDATAQRRKISREHEPVAGRTD